MGPQTGQNNFNMISHAHTHTVRYTENEKFAQRIADGQDAKSLDNQFVILH